MLEPLANPFIALSKKYLSTLAKMVPHLSIDRYHYVIILIDSQENLTQKALAEILHIDKSYMVTILNYLEDKGYVMRNKNPNDRREQLIGLTALANQSLPLIKSAIESLNKLAFQDICESNRQVFQEVLFTLQNNLAELPQNIEITSPSILENYN